jgi:hypothetical protein
MEEDNLNDDLNELWFPPKSAFIAVILSQEAYLRFIPEEYFMGTKKTAYSLSAYFAWHTCFIRVFGLMDFQRV